MGEIALQTSWGVPIALYLFLGGLAGGTALVSGIIQLKWGERFKNIVRFGAWAATLLLVAGVLCLVSEVTMPLRAMQLWASFTNPASWMTIGAWLLVAGIVGIGLFALAATPAIGDRILGTKAPAVKRVLAVVAAVLGCCIALYTGILIGVLVNHPLWNSWLLPVLFTVSAIDTGVALVGLYTRLGHPLGAPAAASAKNAGPKNAQAGVAPATAKAPTAPSTDDNTELAKLTELLEKGSIGLIIVEMAVLLVFLLLASGTGEIGALSVWLLVAGPLAPAFWLLLVIAGLIAPLALEIMEARRRARNRTAPRSMALVAAALVLVGGLALRFLILYAGLPLSL